LKWEMTEIGGSSKENTKFPSFTSELGF